MQTVLVPIELFFEKNTMEVNGNRNVCLPTFFKIYSLLLHRQGC